MLKLMLIREVEGLGQPGDIVRVRPGFARNFLLPRRLAAPVSDDAMRQAAGHQKRLAAQAVKRRQEAENQAKVLIGTSVHVEARAAEGGTLYGSVTAAMIAEAIVKEGVQIEESAVLLEAPIKELGIYEVPVQLFEGVTSTVKLYVVQPAPTPGSA